MKSIKDIAFVNINRLIEKIIEEGYQATHPVEGNYQFESIISRDKQKVKLQLFFGKKGVKTVIQGDVNTSLYKEIMNIISGSEVMDLKIEEFSEPDTYIGSDESGKGDFFGPLVIAAAAVDKKSKQELRKLGIKDSKECSDKDITLIAPQLKKILHNKFTVKVVKPADYNSLYEIHKNLNRLLARLHFETISTLLQKVDCKEIIIDKFGNEKLLIAEFSVLGSDIKLHQFTKAERYMGVAAASILAREAFINWFDEIGEKTGINLPKGASDEVIKALRVMVDKYGDKAKERLVKLHFKNSLQF